MPVMDGAVDAVDSVDAVAAPIHNSMIGSARLERVLATFCTQL